MESQDKTCCQPQRKNGARQIERVNVTSASAIHTDLISLSAATFLMGSDDPSFPADGEAPVREVSLDASRISPYAVSNADFKTFVDATGYKTEAECFGWSFVFLSVFTQNAPRPPRRLLLRRGGGRCLGQTGGSLREQARASKTP